MNTEIWASKLMTDYFCLTLWLVGLNACWILTNVVHLPTDSSSSDVEDYRPISSIYLLSKVFEKLVVGKLSHF